MRGSLRIAPDWPVSFDSLSLQLDIRFDRPWDLAAIEGARPQPREITLELAEAAWGPLLLRATGQASVDAAGLPTGEISFQARNWRDILSLAETAGFLPSQLRPQVEGALQILAGTSGNPDTIDVTLKLSNGMVMLGFLPLAPAPRLLLR